MAPARGAADTRLPMATDTPVARNRKALHDYEILEKFEAGLVLLGPEVKSIRDGRVNLKDGYADLRGGELYLHNVHISPYEAANRYNADPTRSRKVLVHKNELRRLVGKAAEKGLTIVPLDIHFSRGYVKVTLALARGKRYHDKRETIRRRELDREMERAVKNA
jgi:SsrA-binding protein